MPIQLVHTRPDARVLQAGPILVVHYFGPATIRSANDDFDVGIPIIERFGEMSFLVVLEANLVGRPRPRVLATVDERLRGMGSKIRCSALVVRGSGIAPPMMRTVLSGVAFITREQQRRKVFRDVREGLTWLQAFEGQLPAAQEVRLETLELALKLPEQLSL